MLLLLACCCADDDEDNDDDDDEGKVGGEEGGDVEGTGSGKRIGRGASTHTRSILEAEEEVKEGAA